MSATAPNLNAVNETIAFLSNAVAETESKLKTEEEKRKKLTKECDLLSNEIQNKAMEITQLRKENDELIKENTDLKQKLDKNDKEIEDLSLFKSIHEKQNYDFLMEQKKKVELEKIEMEDKYNEMKANFENEHKNLINLDKQFYEYKKEVEAQAIKDKELKEKLEKEIIEQKDEIEITKKNYKETDNKLKEALDVVKNLQKESERKKAEMEELKTESHNKVEEIKLKMEKASQSVFSQEKILNIIAENIHIFFEQEFNLSFTKIIEDIFKNFIIYTQSIFSTSENGDKYIHNDENLFLYNLKDIYFFIYFYIFNLKQNKKEREISTSISSSDFSEEIINEISNKIYEKNMIHITNTSSQKTVNEYLTNLKKLGISEEHLEKIKEIYNKKNEKFNIYLLNLIKSLVKKCTDTFRNGTIEMNNRILYDFRNYTGEEFSFSKNNLQIFCEKINNENMDIIINKLKYSLEPISRIHFHNNFNQEFSEFNIQKILLNIMTYNPNLLSLSFSKYENISSNVLSYIIFCIQNLKNMKILSFESCKLTDAQMKLISEGIKDNKNIIALMLRKNNITSQGGIYISEYINNNKNMRQLFLGDNKIKDQGLKNIFETMSNVNRNITNLDLSNNNFGLEDFNNLTEYLKTNPILNSLDISGNKLSLKSSINLGATLCSMKNIKSLNMSNMGIISEFIPNLFRSFNLEEIILDDNNLEEVGLIMLIKGLEGDKNLKKISLKNTQLSSIGLTSLLKMLDKVKDFRELHLENNTIDDMSIGIMKNMLKTKKFKIFVSKNLINQELFRDDALGKESNIIMV
jgi:Ran GTPase-activating protein (RanGAP) involved in mRNA processing and transport